MPKEDLALPQSQDGASPLRPLYLAPATIWAIYRARQVTAGDADAVIIGGCALLTTLLRHLHRGGYPLQVLEGDHAIGQIWLDTAGNLHLAAEEEYDG